MRNRMILGTFFTSAKGYNDYFVPAQKMRTLIKQDFDKLTCAGISVRSTNNILKLINRFGFDKPFWRMDIEKELEITKSPASDILNKLLSIGAIVSVTGAGKGKYKFSTAFFEKS